MRLALINPPQPYLIEPQTQVPLGLLYLSAVVKRERPDIDVRVFDASLYSVEEAVERAGEADVYGFTATTLDYEAAREMAQALSKRYLGCGLIVGGPHATVFGEELQKRDNWDSVFVGESEGTILTFLDDLHDSSRQRPRARVVYVPHAPADVTKLPWPDREALDWIGGRVLTDRSQTSSINLMAARGCPYDCHFCASKTIWGRKVRWRAVEDVVDEIKAAMEKWGTAVFRFSDDNMTTSRRWTQEFCRLVKPLNIKWRLSVRVDTPPDLLNMMAEAGCTELGLGIESFDPDVLKVLDKRITPEQSLRTVEHVHNAGIGPRLLLMISTPGETYQKTVDLNIAALESVKGKFVYASSKTFVPLPGTAIWNDPDGHDITIESRDFNRYNFYVYRRSEAGGSEKVLWSPISIGGMSKAQQMENIERMTDYMETLDANADG